MLNAWIVSYIMFIVYRTSCVRISNTLSKRSTFNCEWMTTTLNYYSMERWPIHIIRSKEEIYAIWLQCNAIQMWISIWFISTEMSEWVRYATGEPQFNRIIIWLKMLLIISIKTSIFNISIWAILTWKNPPKPQILHRSIIVCANLGEHSPFKTLRIEIHLSCA